MTYLDRIRALNGGFTESETGFGFVKWKWNEYGLNERKLQSTESSHYNHRKLLVKN